LQGFKGRNWEKRTMEKPKIKIIKIKRVDIVPLEDITSNKSISG
jgi:hypothetical protein